MVDWHPFCVVRSSVPFLAVQLGNCSWLWCIHRSIQFLGICLLARPVVLWSMGSSSTTNQGFDCLARVICHCACCPRIWGGAWSHNRILFHCDNLAVVELWEKQSTRDKALMQLVWSLYGLATESNFLQSRWFISAALRTQLQMHYHGRG